MYYIMSNGIIVNCIKYICLYNDNELKNKSLEDNVYFTLRDIFDNIRSDLIDMLIEINEFNHILSGGICYEERTESFSYTRMLYDKDYLINLINFLKKLNEYSFEFNKPEENKEIQINEYMVFDEWLKQFERLKKSLDNQYNMLIDI